MAIHEHFGADAFVLSTLQCFCRKLCILNHPSYNYLTDLQKTACVKTFHWLRL